jgi:hypothetical protein
MNWQSKDYRCYVSFYAYHYIHGENYRFKFRTFNRSTATNAIKRFQGVRSAWFVVHRRNDGVMVHHERIN